MTPEHEETPSPALEEETRRVAEDVQHRTLEEMPGHFRRLIYLASLRDLNTGRYRHPDLACRFSSDAVSEGLRRCHAQVFQQITSLRLQEQTQDLIRFFESLNADRGRVVEVWRRVRAFEVLPPEQCHPLARQLFCKNVEIILQVLQQTELWELLSEPHGDAHHMP